MPGTPQAASQPPQVLLARIIASATIRSSGEPRLRGTISTRSSPTIAPPSATVEPEAVVGTVEVLGLAANLLAARLEVPRQAVQEGQLGGERQRCAAGRRRASSSSISRLEDVVAQVGGDPDALEARLARQRRQRRLVDRHVERDDGGVAALGERERVDDGRRAAWSACGRGCRPSRGGRARSARPARAGLERERRRGDVDAERRPGRCRGPAPRARRRSRSSTSRRSRTRPPARARASRRRSGTAASAKPTPFGNSSNRKRRQWNSYGESIAPRRLEQIERRPAGAPRRLDDRLVLGRVLVGLEQDAIELLADRRRARAGDELGGPGVDLHRDQALPLDAEQRRLDDLFRRLAKAPLAEAAEVVRRGEQAEQRRRFLRHVGLGAEVVARQLGEGELAFGREFPGEVEVDLARDRLGRGEQRLGLGRRRSGAARWRP